MSEDIRHEHTAHEHPGEEHPGEEHRGRFDLRRDGLGISLFTVGAFFSVLLVMALGSAGPLEQARGTGALARIWSGSIGLWPGLFICAGFAVLGARLFLAGGAEKLLRHAGGLALSALALSFLLGSLSATAGGAFGDHSGGELARSTHVALAALAGIAACGASVWLAWVKPALEASPRTNPRARPTAALAGSDPYAPDDGVTPAEAAALIPEDLPAWRTEPRMPRPEFAATPAPPSPYREDVRRRGEIPEGARPLHSPHVDSPTHTEARDDLAVSSVQHWAPPSEPAPSHDAAGEDLARAEDADFLLEPPAPILVEGSAAGRRIEGEEESEEEDELSDAIDENLIEVAIEASIAGLAEEDVDEESEDPADEFAGEFAGEVPEESLEELPTTASVPPPSWEQTSMFAVEEEPVDSYGTPLTLVESIHASEITAPEIAAPEIAERKARAAAEASEDLAPPVDTEAAAEEREVVLKPKKSPARKKAKARRRPEDQDPADVRDPDGDRAKMLIEIGCLLVDRGRVAVSMLQKQYGMDFEEATRTLDELQAMGLIGPYLGGQRRDILLTREEWLEKASSL